MQLKDIQNIFHKELDTIYGKDEVASFFYLLTETYYNVSRFQLAIAPNFTITKDEQESIFNALEALKQQKPIQYILGETEFYGLAFKVNEHTLIPRPETEELVSQVLENINKFSPFGRDVAERQRGLNILDIGTGTGCIAVSLAKNLPNAQVFALDVSKEALKVAKQNAELNEVDVTFIEASILDETTRNLELSSLREDVAERQMGLEFDIIVSNPPYVRNLEKTEMKPNVLDNEPHLALFVEDDNPLIFYDAITKFAVNNLTQNGQLFFEINEYLGNEMKALLEHHNFKNIELKKDMFEKDRMICGVKN